MNNFKGKKAYGGTVTASTKKRIARTVDLLLQLSPEKKKFNPVTKKVIKHKLSFITLTLPPTDKLLQAKEAYKLLLSKWLRYMRDKGYITTYIWKAELQKNGQIHYHITTPSVIEYQVIKDTWNNLLRKNNLLVSFKNKYGHDNPNSTDIHQVKKINNIQAYLTKYLCKSEQNQEATTGKLWDCSLDLKGRKFYTTDLSTTIENNIWKAHVAGNLDEIDTDKCIILPIKNMHPSSLLPHGEKKMYKEFLSTFIPKRERLKQQQQEKLLQTIFDNSQVNKQPIKKQLEMFEVRSSAAEPSS